MADTTYRACTVITLAVGLPAFIAAVATFVITMQSNDALSIIGMAIAVLLGIPILIAVALACAAIRIRPRRPDTARTLAVTGVSIIGAIATLAAMIWAPGLSA